MAQFCDHTSQYGRHYSAYTYAAALYGAGGVTVFLRYPLHHDMEQ